MITILSVAFPDSTHLRKLKISLQEEESSLPMKETIGNAVGELAQGTRQWPGAYFVGEHRFEAPAEVAEVISVLVHLHALAVVLDLGVHPVGTLLHGVLDGLAGLSLGERGSKHSGDTWKIKLLFPKFMNELQ